MVIADLDRMRRAAAAATEIGGPDVAVGVRSTCRATRRGRDDRDRGVRLRRPRPDCQQCRALASPSHCLRPPRRSGTSNTTSWPRAHSWSARRRGRHDPARMGGDIVYISLRTPSSRGPTTSPTAAAKADQAHQVRLLAAELGEHQIRVNGVNPDGVVRGSDLRRRLGRRPRRGLRRRGGGAGRVLRATHPAQARGAARARRRRRLRARSSRPQPHDGTAHPGRRRSRRRLPALSRRSG